MEVKENLIPEISDAELEKRMNQIRFVKPVMVGIDGKPYTTDETDERLFDLFYSESKVDPRTQAFNFDEGSVLTTKAESLKELMKTNIFVKIGGYHGFCKATMAEVMSQIPELVLPEAVAFALDPKQNPSVLNEDYQSLPIIIYGKSDEPTTEQTNLPKADDLIKPIDLERANRLKDKIKPIILYGQDEFVFVDPNDINQPFIHVGIWLRIGGSNLHKTNPETSVPKGCKRSDDKLPVYTAFSDAGADFYQPTYAHMISQIPDEKITEKTIGIAYRVPTISGRTKVLFTKPFTVSLKHYKRNQKTTKPPFDRRLFIIEWDLFYDSLPCLDHVINERVCIPPFITIPSRQNHIIFKKSPAGSPIVILPRHILYSN